ncbi:MAG: hypothetical protein ABF297_14665, partial [Thiogranum sp.]
AAKTLIHGIDLALAKPLYILITGIVVAAIGLYLHFQARRWAAGKVLGEIRRENSEEEGERLSRAFKRNTTLWRSIFDPDPAGWTGRNRKALKAIIRSANQLVQALNDRFTDPSGKRPVAEEVVPEKHAPVVTGEVMPREEPV